jgi:hypothetical protein
MSNNNKVSFTTWLASMGASLAIVISYNLNHSIGWAIWHGVLCWFYVIYRLIVGH